MVHRQVAFASALIAAAVSTSHAAAPAIRQSQLEQEVRAAREASLPHGLFQTGSGFYVSDGSLVLTSAHVVAGCRVITIRDISGREQAGTLVLWDGLRDIAVLRPDRTGPAGLSLLAEEGPSDRPPEKLKVFAQNFELKTSIPPRQIVVSRLPDELRMGSSKMLELDASLETGMSGSPIVDDDGDAIGMVTARLEVKSEGGPRTVSVGVEASDLAAAVQWVDGRARSRDANQGANPGALTVRVRCR